MTREIKFRAWDGEHMMDVTWIDLKDGKPFLIEGYYHGSGKGSLHQHEIKALLQFTGLKDKHGKEIYEGDIVRTENEQVTAYPVEEEYKGVVAYEQCCFLIQQPHGTYTPTLNNITIKSIDIIGNIHETPELLERK